MARRPATTIVLITREGLVRADFLSGQKPTLQNIWQDARPETDDPALLVETALSFGPKPGRQVWVFSSDCWSQTLTLPSGRTVGISADDLAGALNFEAEALSGHSAFESVVGQTYLKTASGENVYWVVQMKYADRDRVANAVHRAGGRLAGIGHPGGLPRPLHPTGAIDDSWQRVELWPDGVVCLRGDGKEPPDVHFLHVDPRHGRWQSAVEKVWSEGGAPEHSELLAAEQIATPAGYASEPVLHLDNPAVLGKWLTAWAEHLARQPAGVPVIRPITQPMPMGQRVVIGALCALLAAALCGSHYYFFFVKTGDRLRAELQKAKEPAKVFGEVEKQVKELETKCDTLQKQENKLRQDNDTLVRQRRRLSDLLCVLAEQRGEHLLIEKIDSGGGEPRIHGLCLRPEMADEFARKLGQTLEAQGWRVELAHKEAKIVQNDGAPWAFELRLKEAITNNTNITASQGGQPAGAIRRK